MVSILSWQHSHACEMLKHKYLHRTPCQKQEHVSNQCMIQVHVKCLMQRIQNAIRIGQANPRMSCEMQPFDAHIQVRFEILMQLV